MERKSFLDIIIGVMQNFVFVCKYFHALVDVSQFLSLSPNEEHNAKGVKILRNQFFYQLFSMHAIEFANRYVTMTCAHTIIQSNEFISLSNYYAIRILKKANDTDFTLEISFSQFTIYHGVYICVCVCVCRGLMLTVIESR